MESEISSVSRFPKVAGGEYQVSLWPGNVQKQLGMDLVIDSDRFHKTIFGILRECTYAYRGRA